MRQGGLVATEEVASVNLGLNVIEDGIVAVGDDGIALCLELIHIVDHLTTKERGSIGKGGFVDNDCGSLGFDAFHHTLNAALTEIVGIGLHGEAEHTNGHVLLCLHGIAASCGIVVIACLLQHLIGYEILTGAVTLHDRRHHLLGHILVVCQQLFRVFRQTVTSIAK